MAATSAATDPVLGDGGARLLPLWAFMYVRAVTTQAEAAAGPLGGRRPRSTAVLRQLPRRRGEGGVGYPFADGEVLKTFPHIEDQLRFVYYGTEQYAAAGVDDLRRSRPRGRPARGVRADRGGDAGLGRRT